MKLKEITAKSEANFIQNHKRNMAKKNYTWKLDEDLVSKIQKKAAKEHRSLTNYIEVLLLKDAKKVDEINTKNTTK